MGHRLSILQSASREDVRFDPFPHLLLPSCLPEGIYQELSESFPADALICELDAWRRPQPGENKRVDISAASFLKNRDVLPSIWVDFVAYHTSQEFFQEMLSIFGDVIQRHYPLLEDRIGTLSTAPTGVRFAEQMDSQPLSLDCQVGINTPGRSTSVVIGPHCDSPDELYAGLLYFRRPEDDAEGGNLDLFSWKHSEQKLFRDGHKIADASLIERQATIPYAANTLVMFINTLDSVHGVTPRSPSSVSRRLVNVIGEVYNAVPGGLFERPQVSIQTTDNAANGGSGLLRQPGLFRQKVKAKLKALRSGFLRREP